MVHHCGEKSTLWSKNKWSRVTPKFLDILKDMGCLPTKAHPDLWIKDCGSHYEYLATYVDDIMIFSRKGEELLERLKEEYLLKNVGEPEYYLGEILREEEDMMERKCGQSLHEPTLKTWSKRLKRCLTHA